jgi:hypothetical protein
MATEHAVLLYKTVHYQHYSLVAEPAGHEPEPVTFISHLLLGLPGGHLLRDFSANFYMHFLSPTPSYLFFYFWGGMRLSPPGMTTTT